MTLRGHIPGAFYGTWTSNIQPNCSYLKTAGLIKYWEWAGGKIRTNCGLKLKILFFVEFMDVNVITLQSSIMKFPPTLQICLHPFFCKLLTTSSKATLGVWRNHLEQCAMWYRELWQVDGEACISGKCQPGLVWVTAVSETWTSSPLTPNEIKWISQKW